MFFDLIHSFDWVVALWLLGVVLSLWVSTATGLTTSGTVTITSNSSSALVVAGSGSFGGRLTAALQPGFLAYNSASDAGVSGAVAVQLDTEVYDDAGHFAANTFTCPVTGRYLFVGSLATSNFSIANTGDVVVLALVTSNRTYSLDSEFIQTGALVNHQCGGSVIADMDVGDTAFLRASVTNVGSFTINGGGPGGTYFSGRLLP